MSGDGAALPVITIGGYLGSGKTTLVNNLLRRADGRRLAVLVNEFGELAIDADLIVAEDDDLISIAGGCICCTFGNDLLGALRDLARLDPPPDYVIIESSGVAIPAAIVSAFSLVEGFRSDGIVVVVDAETVRRAAADDYIGDTITRQLGDAEIVVVNKLDLLGAPGAEALNAWLATMAPGAALVPARFGDVAPQAILGVVAEPSRGHAAAHSDAGFESLVLTPPPGVDAAALARDLATGGHGVIRAKGHVTGADGQTWLIQTVGARWQAEPVGERHAPGVVCIGLAGGLRRDRLGEGLPEISAPMLHDHPSPAT